MLAFVDALAPVLVLTAALGVVFALMQPAEFSLVPLLAGRRMQEANGHVETFRYIGFGVGPVLGGLLFAVGGLELAMVVDAVDLRRRRAWSRSACGSAASRSASEGTRSAPATGSPTCSATGRCRW